MPPNMIPAEGGITCNLRESVIRDALFGLCSDADYEYALTRMRPEPLKPLVTPAAGDRAIDSAACRAPTSSVRRTAPSRSARSDACRPYCPAIRCSTLASDHSPFFSQPAALAQMLGGL